MIYLSLLFSLNATNPGFICEIVRIFRGVILVVFFFLITRITSYVFCKVRHIRFVLVGIYIWVNAEQMLLMTQTTSVKSVGCWLSLCFCVMPWKLLWWATIKLPPHNKIKCYLKNLVPSIEFFFKDVSKQLFNKITVRDDNAEFMSSLRSQWTCITECKLVTIRKLPVSFTPIFSVSVVWVEENIYRPLKSPEKTHTLLVTLPSILYHLVLVEVLCFQLFSERLLIAQSLLNTGSVLI